MEQVATTEVFAASLEQLAAETLPTEVSRWARQTFAGALTSARAGGGSRVEEALRSESATHVAAVIAASAAEGRSCPAHALVNVAAALASEATGARRLTAFALGCEAQLRLSLALSDEPAARGWDTTCVTGVVSAAITACVAGGADGDVLRRAIGIAGAQALGRRTADGTAVASYSVGRAAANGYLAFLLAREGFTSPGAMLDAERGYLGVLTNSPDLSHLRDDWRTRWYLLDDPIFL